MGHPRNNRQLDPMDQPGDGIFCFPGLGQSNRHQSTVFRPTRPAVHAQLASLAFGALAGIQIFFLIAALLSMVACVLLMAVVEKITRRQQEKYKNLKELQEKTGVEAHEPRSVPAAHDGLSAR